MSEQHDCKPERYVVARRIVKTDFRQTGLVQTEFEKERKKLLGTNGNVVVVSDFMCSVYAIRL